MMKKDRSTTFKNIGSIIIYILFPLTLLYVVKKIFDWFNQGSENDKNLQLMEDSINWGNVDLTKSQISGKAAALYEALKNYNSSSTNEMLYKILLKEGYETSSVGSSNNFKYSKDTYKAIYTTYGKKNAIIWNPNNWFPYFSINGTLTEHIYFAMKNNPEELKFMNWIFDGYIGI